MINNQNRPHFPYYTVKMSWLKYLLIRRYKDKYIFLISLQQHTHTHTRTHAHTHARTHTHTHKLEHLKAGQYTPVHHRTREPHLHDKGVKYVDFYKCTLAMLPNGSHD